MWKSVELKDKNRDGKISAKKQKSVSLASFQMKRFGLWKDLLGIQMKLPDAEQLLAGLLLVCICFFYHREHYFYIK